MSRTQTVGCGFDYKCPWCGEDQLSEMIGNGASFDTIMDGHAEECVPFQQEINGVPQGLPPCSGDEE